jgi:DNA-binding Lrp family transcriptional regulator
MKGCGSMSDSQRRPWTFLTSHARVLILISQNPNIRVRDVAEMAGITERSAQRIIVELEDDGYLTHEKIGRRNRYMLSPDATLRHPLEQAVEIRFLLDVFRVDGDHGSTTEG